MKFCNISETENWMQGNVQGAMFGIACLASGLGSPAFAYVFALCTEEASKLPYYPGELSNSNVQYFTLRSTEYIS